MRRSTMIAGGTMLGVAGVIALPHPSTPQEVAVAGNSAATGSGSNARSTASAAGTTTGTAANNASARAASTKPAAKTVTGALATDQYGQLR